MLTVHHISYRSHINLCSHLYKVQFKYYIETHNYNKLLRHVGLYLAFVARMLICKTQASSGVSVRLEIAFE